MELLIFFVILIFSVILHEVMHGVVAERLGDPTARVMGRITLNPIPHIDPVGTILLPALFIIPALVTGTPPGAFIAWAKPVPVNPLYFKDGKKDMALTALAGPLTNFVLALILVSVYHIFKSDFLIEGAYVNLFLAFLNLVPVPPLDGSKVISIVLSDEAAFRLQSIGQTGIIILFLLLSFTPLGSFLTYLAFRVLQALGVS
jgi:Zn-dependent protease